MGLGAAENGRWLVYSFPMTEAQLDFNDAGDETKRRIQGFKDWN